MAQAPDVVARLYERHGTAAFALLDGDFSLVLFDPNSQTSFLVVDKLGCNDIFVRETDNYFLFGSHSTALLEADEAWDPITVAFFLAQEGFVPSPFTLSPGVKGIGRARCLRLLHDTNGLQVDCQRYWVPDRTWDLPSRRSATTKFFDLVKNATSVRTDPRSSLLLSAGVDSSLLANLAVPLAGPDFVSVTGAVKGFKEWEAAIGSSAELAAQLKIRHESILLDPADQSIPEEWALCTGSWMTGARATTPLFLRCGMYLRDRLGEGYTALSGQMADTLADNNYTTPSAGYTFRRAFCSPWFLSLMPWLAFVVPRKEGFLGNTLVALVNTFGGPGFAAMMESVLDGMTNAQRFYEGRLFGYGEMPGRSAAYFPALTEAGLDQVANWYSSNFVKPVASGITPRNFYGQMIDLSMDMCMLHLDTRLVLQIFRLTKGKAHLPFLDARVVNFFCSLPYSARAFYREPKHVIRDQFRSKNLLHVASNHRAVSARDGNIVPADELLLRGSLGAYFRDLLRDCTLPNRVHSIFDIVDEGYFFNQLSTFIRGNAGTNYTFISKLAALELWHQQLATTERLVSIGTA